MVYSLCGTLNVGKNAAILTSGFVSAKDKNLDKETVYSLAYTYIFSDSIWHLKINDIKSDIRVGSIASPEGGGSIPPKKRNFSQMHTAHLPTDILST